MNDRELLELAAKAAGVDFYTPEGGDTPWCGRGFYLRGVQYGTRLKTMEMHCDWLFNCFGTSVFGILKTA